MIPPTRKKLQKPKHILRSNSRTKGTKKITLRVTMNLFSRQDVNCYGFSFLALRHSFFAKKYDISGDSAAVGVANASKFYTTVRVVILYLLLPLRAILVKLLHGTDSLEFFVFISLKHCTLLPKYMLDKFFLQPRGADHWT